MATDTLKMELKPKIILVNTSFSYIFMIFSFGLESTVNLVRKIGNIVFLVPEGE